MLPISKSKIKHRKLILSARFSADFLAKEFFPEIEMNCHQYAVDPSVIERFHQYKYAENSMYFHHNYAYADIPCDQEYEYIALISKGKIQHTTIRKCKTKVLCFITAYKTIPIEYANHGHHENCLIQFEDGIPDIINELYEINEKKSIEIKQEICLCSDETLQANLNT